MFKMSFSKIKKLCSVVLIPRILRDEVTLSPRKLGKRPLDGFWKMAKSTDSKDREAECEKCKKLIEMAFGHEKPESLLKQVEANIEDIQTDKIHKVIAPNITVNEKSNDSDNNPSIEKLNKEIESNVSEIPAERTDESKIKSPINQSAIPLNNILEATTAKATEEQLAQKLETIEEPGIVGAATPKVDGFNTPPKVLGDQENLSDKKLLYTKISPEEEAIDKIAKKCLSAPPDKIDERILEEMKSCGMLGRGRKKPTSRKSGYHAVKSDTNKEELFDTKTEDSTLFYNNEHKTNSAINNYLRYQNTKSAHSPQNVYPYYYRNVPLVRGDRSNKQTDLQEITATDQKELKIDMEDVKTNVVEKPLPHSSEYSIIIHSDKNSDVDKITKTDHNEIKTELENVNTDLEIEKPLLLSSDCSTLDESDKQNTVINDQTCDKTEVLEGVFTKTISTEEGKSKELNENVEAEVEEIRVTTVEASQIRIPGETEMDPDFDNKKIKPDILTTNEILQTGGIGNSSNEIEHVVLASNKHPTDWHYRSDLPEPPFINPNTAISSTFPVYNQQKNPELVNVDTSTSISSRQNPDEYFDVSRCNTEKVANDIPITLAEIRPFPAFHQYTIITAEEPEHVVFSTKYAPEIASLHTPELKIDPEIETDLSSKLQKDISSAIGPLPELKGMEGELSLTELLKRVRERNRLLYCRECAIKAFAAAPAEASKCPPPLDKGPTKTLGPGPCKPKPKPACPPAPPPPPCKPKDPCAKFSKTTILGDKIKEAFTLVLQIGIKPASSPDVSNKNISDLEPPLISDDSRRMEKLENLLLSSSPENKEKPYENEDIALARDFEPWSPIPSWPIPKKEKKIPFVCPKEGCKLIPPPRLSDRCKENPCTSFPKRKFSLLDFDYEPLYLYHNEI